MPTAIGFSRYGAPEVLHPLQIETPRPGPGQALVRVRAAGVNPVDCKIRRGEFAGAEPRRFPQRLGNEFAGTVVELGPDNPAESAVAVGTDVLGSASAQAYAETLVVDTAGLVVKPPSVPWEAAAGLPAAGQTARTALLRLDVRPGDVVLVHAAAGGVGTIAVQLARELGARVIGTASEANHDYLRGLGAVPVAYGPGLTERVRALVPEGIDAALDLVGGEAVTTSLALVGDRRRIGTTVDRKAVEEHGVQRVGGRSHAALREVADMAAADRLTLPVRTFPLGEAASAHRAVETGHVRGKVVLLVPGLGSAAHPGVAPRAPHLGSV
ncbi:NADP-dependent oxidoreductase [Streptomonospora sp. PA3]|uniref:NADP-dependent oxidoreductase n=1 Tax=Streptomonospora sp. PA3 TaxID=2607326 RepID=UPI0012DE28AA|nr:NADP-dependent oxidoreductase [Streptomonospora sp. PA3]MUL41509.1 NADP-dependent oxidoreductase [Streptomonospora sp. PA3]